MSSTQDQSWSCFTVYLLYCPKVTGHWINVNSVGDRGGDFSFLFVDQNLKAMRPSFNPVLSSILWLQEDASVWYHENNKHALSCRLCIWPGSLGPVRLGQVTWEMPRVFLNGCIVSELRLAHVDDIQMSFRFRRINRGFRLEGDPQGPSSRQLLYLAEQARAAWLRINPTVQEEFVVPLQTDRVLLFLFTWAQCHLKIQEVIAVLLHGQDISFWDKGCIWILR